ncbi:hypothetical protein K445DRAFT_17193 [Daldinia sp. EC12]|nr:hypothetical protein K445DRAFT_17193 [Daldinia sp. EC12]
MKAAQKELRAAEYEYIEKVKRVQRYGNLVSKDIWRDYKDALERLDMAQQIISDRINARIRMGNLAPFKFNPPFKVCGSPGVDDDEGTPSPFFRNFESLEPVVPTPLVQRPRRGHENYRHEPYLLPQSRSKTAVPSNYATSESGASGKQSTGEDDLDIQPLVQFVREPRPGVNLPRTHRPYQQLLPSTSADGLSRRTHETPDELALRIQEIMQVIIDNRDMPSHHTWELLTDIFDSSRRT